MVIWKSGDKTAYFRSCAQISCAVCAESEDCEVAGMSITIWTRDGMYEHPAGEGKTLLELLWEQGGQQVHAPCGGKGLCGKCTVTRVLDGGEEEVLACQTVPEDGEVYRLPKIADLAVETEGLKADIRPDDGLSGYGIACDIGTTTIVCHLIRLDTGQCIATAGEGNEQARFGADVISRIQVAAEGRLNVLTDAVRRQLIRMTARLCGLGGVERGEITRMAVAANTTMCHLLAGLNPQGLGAAPFTPVSRFGNCYGARELRLSIEGEVYVLPAVSGYVGGDITADVLAAGMDRTDEVTLLIDVGTNGEMVLGCSGRMVCCSTAAGPAFEGAQIECGMTAARGAVSSVRWEDGRVAVEVIGDEEASGICGSGLIDAVAMLLDLGVLDETGRMLDIEEDEIPDECRPYLELDAEGIPIFRLSERVYISQSDVRKLQLGKGAIAAGTQVLLDTYGIRAGEVKQLLLAGGFGSFIHVPSAARIGLIPAELAERTHSVGNAAAVGAVMALVSGPTRERLQQIQGSMEYYELSGLAAFNNAYMESMMFPEE